MRINASAEGGPRKYTRRQVLGYLTTLTGILVTGGGSNPAQASLPGSHSSQRDEPSQAEKPNENEKGFFREGVETSVETALMTAARAVAKVFMKKVHVGENEPPKEKIIELVEDMRTESFEGLLMHTSYKPFMQEALRGLLSAMSGKTKFEGLRWDVGIPVAFVEALLKNTDSDIGLIGNVGIPTLRLRNEVPLSQFMGGLWYWYLMREKGFSHAFVAHSQHNSIAVLIGMALLQRYPGPKGEEKAAEAADLLE